MTGWPDDWMTRWLDDQMTRWPSDDLMTGSFADDWPYGILTPSFWESIAHIIYLQHLLSFFIGSCFEANGHLFDFYLSSTIANRSDRNIAPWKFTQWVWCLFVSWQYSFSSSHPGPAQQEVKQARPSPLHNSPAVRIMRQKLSHTLFILTRYKHWQAAAAGD